ncbi:MAG: DUF4294 domain-containing protein [Bacteroidia bacterium]
MRYILLIFLAVFAFQPVSSQEVMVARIGVEGDTTIMKQLKVVEVRETMGRKARRQMKKYDRLMRDIKITMPYAKLAAQKIKDMDEHMMTLPTEKQRQAYLKAEEKKLMDEFTDQLKNLTVRQGKLLIKLIDRETGNTSYHLIKEYKSGLTAFFWQGLAKVFGMNLKDAYNAEEEQQIETIIFMLGYS